MSVTISEIGHELWDRYSQVSTQYEVRSLLQCQPIGGGMGGIALVETVVGTPYTKQFAADDLPAIWARDFDLSRWGIFLAENLGSPVGCATVAPPSPKLVGVERRVDAAFLFDIRVSPNARRQGVGKALLERCVQWARNAGFRFLVIETQNANVPACRLYASCGAELIEIRRLGYAHCAEVAKEAMLIWQIQLRALRHSPCIPNEAFPSTPADGSGRTPRHR